MKVLVVGGGAAGAAAAVAASASGAEVTLLEGSDRLGPNQALFPCILSGECPPEDLRVDASNLLRSGVDLRFNEYVLGIDLTSCIARTAGGRFDFDSLVVATGTHHLDMETKGTSKRGVFLLRSSDDYRALSKSMDGLSHVAVAGSVPLCLVVAQILSRSSKVRVFIGPSGLRRFSPGVGGAIARAATASGVELLNADIDVVVGTGHVEAVVSSGKVYPCDGVVMLPRSAPLLPQTDCHMGSHGGLLVDRWMRTSKRNVFAAGDCAELRLGSASLPTRLYSSSRLMGDVAGVNAAGGAVQARLAGSLALRLFGVEICAAGIEAEEGIRAGLDTVRVDSEHDMDDLPGLDRVYTSLVYDRSTRRVNGIQVAGEGTLALSDYVSLAVALGLSLEELAYHESPYLPNFNRDVCPIALTAGKALVNPEPGTFEAPSTHLRHSRPQRARPPGGL